MKPILGEVIAARLRYLGMSKVKFGEALGVTRQAADHICKKETIQVDLLIEVSKILEFDFLAYMAEASGLDSYPFTLDMELKFKDKNHE